MIVGDNDFESSHRLINGAFDSFAEILLLVIGCDDETDPRWKHYLKRISFSEHLAVIWQATIRNRIPFSVPTSSHRPGSRTAQSCGQSDSPQAPSTRHHKRLGNPDGQPGFLGPGRELGSEALGILCSNPHPDFH